MDPLATPEDVERLGVDINDISLVAFLLESVSDAVRDAAGTPITVVEVELVLPGQWDQSILLPGAPIQAVSEVALNGDPVTDWKLRGNRLWRPQGWGAAGDDISITYTYGVATPPKDIVKLVATFVAAGINEAAVGVASNRNLAYTSIDDWREGYRQGDNEVVDLTEIPERTRRMLRERFSGSSDVTGSF